MCTPPYIKTKYKLLSWTTTIHFYTAAPQETPTHFEVLTKKCSQCLFPPSVKVHAVFMFTTGYNSKKKGEKKIKSVHVQAVKSL